MEEEKTRDDSKIERGHSINLYMVPAVVVEARSTQRMVGKVCRAGEEKKFWLCRVLGKDTRQTYHVLGKNTRQNYHFAECWEKHSAK